MSVNFHNTTQEAGATLLRFEAKAEKQEDVILRFFQAHPGELFAPSQIKARVLPEAEITSVRRAMTDLTPTHLTKTAVKIMGPKGRPEHCWTYVRRSAPAAPSVRAVSNGDLLL